MSSPRAATSVATSSSIVPACSRPIERVALLLGHAAVQRLGAVAAAVERLGELVDLVARAAEDDRRGRRLDVEHAAERGGLVRARDDVGGLADLRRLARRVALAAELDAHRVVEVVAAISTMRGGIVAENSTVWRSAGVAARIASMSSAKPMSSISSASSSTTSRAPSSFSVLRRMWSSARPGVATTTSTPRFSARELAAIGCPP